MDRQIERWAGRNCNVGAGNIDGCGVRRPDFRGRQDHP